MSHKSDSGERIAQRQSLYGVKKRGISLRHGFSCAVLSASLFFALRLFAAECIEVTSAIAPDGAEELRVEVSILACFNTSPVLRNLDYQNA